MCGCNKTDKDCKSCKRGRREKRRETIVTTYNVPVTGCNPCGDYARDCCPRSPCNQLFVDPYVSGYNAVACGCGVATCRGSCGWGRYGAGYAARDYGWGDDYYRYGACGGACGVTNCAGGCGWRRPYEPWRADGRLGGCGYYGRGCATNCGTCRLCVNYVFWNNSIKSPANCLL